MTEERSPSSESLDLLKTPIVDFRLVSPDCGHEWIHSFAANLHEMMAIYVATLKGECPVCQEQAEQLSVVLLENSAKILEELAGFENRGDELLEAVLEDLQAPAQGDIRIAATMLEQQKQLFDQREAEVPKLLWFYRRVRRIGLPVSASFQATLNAYTLEEHETFEHELRQLLQQVAAISESQDFREYLANIPIGVVDYPLFNALALMPAPGAFPALLVDFKLLQCFYDTVKIIMASMPYDKGFPLGLTPEMNRSDAIAKLHEIAHYFSSKESSPGSLEMPILPIFKLSLIAQIVGTGKRFILMHELAHILLEHPENLEASAKAAGRSGTEEQQEDEADDLAITMARHLAISKWPEKLDSEGAARLTMAEEAGPFLFFSCIRLLEATRSHLAQNDRSNLRPEEQVVTRTHALTNARLSRVLRRLVSFVPWYGIQICRYADDLINECIAEIKEPA